MRSTLTAACAAFSLAVASTAYAADVSPLQLRAPPTQAAYNWTGFYVGADAGGMWANNHYGYNNTFAAGQRPFSEGNPSTTKATAAGFAGYNYQAGRTVLGVEAQLGTGAKGSFTNLGGATAKGDFDLHYQGALLGRIGYLFQPQLMVYFQGGAAFTQVSYHGGPAFGGPIGSYGSATKWGWAAGGGVEYALNRNWALRAEYLHADYGSRADRFPTYLVVGHNKLSTDSVRAGLVYRF